VILRHTELTAYRCFLPDLAGFTGFCRTGPSPLLKVLGAELWVKRESHRRWSQLFAPILLRTQHSALASDGGEGGHSKSRSL